MKKLILGAITLCMFSIGAGAQDSFYEGLKKYEGQKFYVYYNAYPVEGEEGHYRIESSGFETTYKVFKTESGLAYNVEYTDNNGRRSGLGSLISGSSVDHFTFPSMLKGERGSDAKIFIDDMLIELEDVSEDGTFKSIGRVSILIKEVEEVEKTKEEKPKKKLTMKERIAATKAKMANAGMTPAQKKFKELNLNEVVANYLKAIKEKQKAADAAQEAKYKAEIENEKAAFLAKRQSQSRGLANRMNERDAKEGKKGSNYTVKNTSGSSVKIITDSGSTTTLSAGGSTTYACITNVFLCVGENSKGSIIANGEDACGKTIEF